VYLGNMARRLDELDYYALLGVVVDASVDDIKAGFRALARVFHPDRFAGDERRQAEAMRIYLRATEAYRVLTHPEQRRLYDARLRAGGQLRLDPEAATRSLRPSQIAGTADGVVAPRARAFLVRAEQARAADDLKQARLNYQIALQHDPGSSWLRRKLAEVEGLLLRSTSQR
jgi:DnaJ-class molecular chaperone